MLLWNIATDWAINNVITISNTVSVPTGHYVIKSINNDSSIKILKRKYKPKRMKK